jgi:UDP-N-acetylmuramate dehydrogenase
MNAGGHGSDVASCLVSARVASLVGGAGPESVPAADLGFGYRHSAVAADRLVLSAEFEVRPAPRAECEAQIREIVAWRRANQPGGQNAGSVFVNPAGDSAGRLVDAAGLKGHRNGSAEVSPKHANFIQADDGGSGDDVIELIRVVRRLVHERMGVLLEPEVEMIGAGR